MNSTLSFVRVITVCSGLVACNSEQIPDGSNLRIYPGEKQFNVSLASQDPQLCEPTNDYYHDVPVIVAFQNAQGSPIGNQFVSIHLDLAENTFSGIPALKLYIDSNQNGVVDHPVELVSSASDSLLVLKTEPYTGHISMTVRMNLSCPYRGELVAFSGPFSSTSVFSVVGNSE